MAALLQMQMLGMTGRTAVMKRKNHELQGALAIALLADKVMADSIQAIVVTDAKGTVRTINPAFTLMTGYSAEEIQGNSVRVIKSDLQGPEFFQEMWLELSTFRQWKGETWQRRKNGDVFPVWMTISAVAEDGGTVGHYVAAFSDITAYKNDHERIEFLAFHDVLTALPNRVLSAEQRDQARLDRALARTALFEQYKSEKHTAKDSRKASRRKLQVLHQSEKSELLKQLAAAKAGTVSGLRFFKGDVDSTMQCGVTDQLRHGHTQRRCTLVESFGFVVRNPKF
jgi:PAS domain S-box-containing protein